MQVLSPNMYNMQLWETSGHAANYKENMFVFEVRSVQYKGGVYLQHMHASISVYMS